MKAVITLATALIFCTIFLPFAQASDCTYGKTEYDATHWSDTLPDGL